MNSDRQTESKHIMTVLIVLIIAIVIVLLVYFIMKVETEKARGVIELEKLKVQSSKCLNQPLIEQRKKDNGNKSNPLPKRR